MSPRKSLISKDVTIRDVAVEAGVSVTLVSFVLNAKMGPNGEYLCSASQSTAKRIIEAAKKLGYHKNTVASSLRSGHSNTIGIIITDITNTCFGDICRKLENLAASAGYLTIVGSSDDQPEKLSLLVDKFLYSGVDGMIISPCPGAEEAISKVIERNIPVVLIDRDVPSLEKVGRVMLDNTDYFIVNEVEAGACLGINLRTASGELLWEEVEKAAVALLEKGVRELCVIHFPEGGVAVRKDGIACVKKSRTVPSSEIVSAVGAGDAFCAGCLYAIHENYPLDRMLEFANASARFNLFSATSTGGAPTLKDIESYLHE